MEPRAALAPEHFDAARFPRKINLGSGTDPRDDYLNIDLHAWNGPDLVADVRALDFLPAQHYDELLAQDVLEHLPRTETLQTLAHWNRLLRVGGRIVIRVPNVLGVAELLTHPENQSPQKQEELLQCLFGTQAYTGDFHFTSFTRPLLEHYLERAGFRPVRFATLHGWLFDVTAEKVRHLEHRPEPDFGALLHASGSHADFVDLCYREILGREADAGGRAFFLGGLERGGLTRETLLSMFLHSPEYDARRRRA